MKKTLMTLALTTAFAAPVAFAEQPIDKVENALKAAEQYGFKHISEIEFEDNGTVEVEGWLDDKTKAEIDISASGEVKNEERESEDGGPVGASPEGVRYAVKTARDQGMTTIEEISGQHTGEVELEGSNKDGKELELSLVTAQRD